MSKTVYSSKFEYNQNKWGRELFGWEMEGYPNAPKFVWWLEGRREGEKCPSFVHLFNAVALEASTLVDGSRLRFKFGIFIFTSASVSQQLHQKSIIYGLIF
jgi:hypothetical protein